MGCSVIGETTYEGVKHNICQDRHNLQLHPDKAVIKRVRHVLTVMETLICSLVFNAVWTCRYISKFRSNMASPRAIKMGIVYFPETWVSTHKFIPC